MQISHQSPGSLLPVPCEDLRQASWGQKFRQEKFGRGSKKQEKAAGSPIQLVKKVDEALCTLVHQN